MKKKICSLFSAVMAIVLILGLAAMSGCESENVLNVYNWEEYISDGSDDTLDVIAEFTERTGIKVNYQTFSSNEDMYQVLKSGAAEYDVVFPSDYMIGKMAEEGMLEALDFSNIPNYEYIDEKYKNLAYDPGNEYSVPYTWGTVGIFYNTKHVDAEDFEGQSWDLLWNEKYSGKILMFDNPRDAFGIALMKLGYSVNTTDTAQWQEAYELLAQQKDIVQAYVQDQVYDIMASGEAWIAPYYSGDGRILIEENEDIAFYIPKTGANTFVDAMCVVKGTKNKKAAEQFINFMCEPEIALANTEYICYSTPHTEAFKNLDPEIKGNPNYYPPQSMLDKCEVFNNLPKNIDELQTELWIDLKT